MPFAELTREELMAKLGPTGSIGRCVLIFHWNNCGPCKRTMPEYIKAAEVSKEEFYSIERDQAMIAPSLLTAFEVRSFPTIVWIDRDSKHCPVFPKTVPRTAVNIGAWVKKLAKEAQLRDDTEKEDLTPLKQAQSSSPSFQGAYRTLGDAVSQLAMSTGATSEQ